MISLRSIRISKPLGVYVKECYLGIYTNYEMGDIQYILADNKIVQDILNENSSNIRETSSNIRKYILSLYWPPTMNICLADQSL